MTLSMPLRASVLVALTSLLGCPEPDPDEKPDTGEATEESATIDTGPSVPLPPSLLDDPVSTTAPPWPTRTHPLQPGPQWADPTGPLPTNAWWQRLTLATGTAPIHPLPYQVRVDGAGISTSYAPTTSSGAGVFLAFDEDVAFGAQGSLGPPRVVEHDPLSVTVQWTASGGATLTTPIVRGMPYVTAQYVDHVAQVRTARAIQSVNGQSVPQTVSGERFELDVSGETWVVYASSAVTFDVTANLLTASEPYTGSLRAAVSTESTAAVLDAHAARIPTGGTVEARVEGDEATLTFEWETEGTGDLLLMRLPHHGPVLSGVTEPGLTLATLRGDMVGVAGDAWTMTEALPTIGFRAPSGIRADRVEDVRAALQADVGLGVPSPDPYFGGKELALLGRHALIADELGETALAEQYRTNLRAELEPWLDGTNADPLVYDETWGGVVVDSGLADPGAAFGQGFYNDHHFHYGYHVYAAAAVAEGDPDWITQWGDPVDHLVRDFANPTTADPHYTVTRNKDWYAGHSWAAGLFDFDRNHESSSEAVNAYYAVALWGQVKGDDRLRDLGRILLALELRAAHTYWQIDSNNPIYPEPFASNRVVGIVFDRRVEYTTFFGARPEFIHGIQWLPFTPMSELLLRPDWMAEAYPVASSGLGAPDILEGWRGFIIMARGINAPDVAWNAAQSLTAYDNGNSRTNTLYWIATRPEP
ncbi:MAG: glycosyl hydrolase [Myxococcota bacterium]